MNEIDLVEKSDMSQAIKELNDDSIDTNRMSRIDMKSRLSAYELPSILAIDNLVAMNVLPESFLQLTRQKKRLSVSINGRGRHEIVSIAKGNQEEANQKKRSVVDYFSKKEK